MSTEDEIPVIRLCENSNKQDLGVYDEIFAEGSLFNGRVMGPEAMKRYSLTTTKAFPDRRIVIEELGKVDEWGAHNKDQLASELAQLWGLPKTVVDVAVARQQFGTQPITRAILAEQQQIADTFLDLGLIPKHVDVLKAAPPDLA